MFGVQSSNPLEISNKNRKNRTYATFWYTICIYCWDLRKAKTVRDWKMKNSQEHIIIQTALLKNTEEIFTVTGQSQR